MLRRNLKPALLGWALGAGILFFAWAGWFAANNSNSAQEGWLAVAIAGLVFVALLVWAVRAHRKPLWVGLLLGAVISPAIFLTVIYAAWENSY